MSGPYANTADAYWQAGWRGILPLPLKAKKNPPSGFTGEAGIDPSYPDVHTWATSEQGAGNIALRLPRNVIGLDVDNYGDKNGQAALQAAVDLYGDLPPTWRTTSRDDGVSGIRLYRVPEGLAWPGELGPATEIIQHKHRYAIVCPSLHPEGRTYRWVNPAGITSTSIPDPDELPALPDLWVEGLTRGEMAVETQRNTWGAAQTGGWLLTLPGVNDPPCARMNKAIEQMRRDLRGSAHCAARDGSLRAIRLASEAHAGLATALTEMQQLFLTDATNAHRETLGKARRTASEANKEWHDLISSAANLVTANPSPAPTCDCDGQITAAIVASFGSLGNTALAPQPTPAPAAEPDSDTGAEPAVEVPRTSWWPRDLAPVMSGHQDEPDPSHLAREDGTRLFYAGKVNGVIGESESGKTWVALLAVAQALAAGETVAYLDFEDTAPGIVNRLRLLSVTDANLSRLIYIGPEEDLHLGARGDLKQTLELHHPSLVVLDGFNAAMTLLGLDLDNNKDATEFSQALLRPLALTGATVIYVDHVPKNRDSRGKGGIGAQAKRAMTTGCALAVEVVAPFGRGAKGKLRLTVDKDRPGHVRAACPDSKSVGMAILASDPITSRVTVRIEPVGFGGEVFELMELISATLESGAVDKATKDGIAKAVHRRADLVRDALANLMQRGCVQQVGAGNGTRYESVKPYDMSSELSPSRPSHIVPDDGAEDGPSPSQPRPSKGRGDGEPSAGSGRLVVDTRTGEVLGDTDSLHGPTS